MEESTPLWLTCQLVEQAFKEHYGDAVVKVKSLSFEPASDKGDNFLGILYRAHVSLTTSTGSEERSLIVKKMLTGVPQETYLRTANLYPIEIEMYRHNLPRLHSILHDSDLAGPNKFSAEFFYASPEKDIIIMEDLMALGFKMARRQNGLDLRHCQLVLKSLAIFHAASVPLIEKEPSSMNLFQESIFKESTREFLETYFTSSIQALILELQKWPGFKERFTDKLQHLKDTCWDHVSKARSRDAQDFTVLNHGDLWINNIMFRYSEAGDVQELRFLDFQCSHESSPASDLLYFLYTSPSDDVRQAHYDTLVQTYHEKLSQTLESLGYGEKTPSLQQLKEQMNKRMGVALFAAICELPNMLAEKGEGYDIDQYFTEDGQAPKENNTYAGEEYKKTIQRLLPLFDSQGLL